jgi:hypothetical protein
MTDREIAEKIGEGPIGQITDPSHPKYYGRYGAPPLYPSYSTDPAAALRVLCYLGYDWNLSKTEDAWCCWFGSNWDSCNTLFEAPTAPLAIIAAFEWFVKQRKEGK